MFISFYPRSFRTGASQILAERFPHITARGYRISPYNAPKVRETYKALRRGGVSADAAHSMISALVSTMFEMADK